MYLCMSIAKDAKDTVRKKNKRLESGEKIYIETYSDKEKNIERDRKKATRRRCAKDEKIVIS